MHRSGSWFERDEGYQNALFQIHSGGHQGQETPVKSCLFCMGPGDTTGMPREPSNEAWAAILALFSEEEDEDDETEDHRRGLTA